MKRRAASLLQLSFLLFCSKQPVQRRYMLNAFATLWHPGGISLGRLVDVHYLLATTYIFRFLHY